ncbi:hypothetical protein DKG77_04465 [Flagellimonas aquimarina]|uniref:DUF3298/DUF4163 domain-containing protein n=1 Tax=Flagellimonas aquimarina TaxID=2201895 RepID=A0A316L594_9FLAO|nr:DUF3298 and DUF4163 domain-containing protein [Allomuricauda koreensis]PWL40085.1 hypothetical protein DKG77_04465 [Allomuricauda koreensis]
MKKPFYLLLVLLLTIGCENEAKLTFEPIQLTGTDCKECPKIEINIPKALDETAVARAINNALEEELIALLSFDEEQEIDKVDDAIISFTNSFKELKTKFPDETVGWEAEVNSEVVYEDDNILTLVFNAYTFTGGAHGYGSTALLNFDKRKGIELENWELFEDIEGFQKFAETKFRIQEDVPQDENINSTGFMFDGDTFHLAENIGYTKDGIQLIYNQYEVASYADGPKILALPYKEVNKYLKRIVKP